MEFLLAILLLLLLAKLLGELTYKFGFSSLVGDVLVGIILGPALLGWIVLTPGDPTSEAIQGVAMLGLVVFMLVVGMNSRFDMLLKVRFKALVISISGMVVSFALGFGLVYSWTHPLLPSLFVAAALSNTATEVVARVAERSRFSHLVISAAFIDDIIAIYVLGILSTAMVKGAFTLEALLWATIGVIAFFLLVGHLSYRLVVRADVMRELWRFERRGIPITFALCLALVLAVTARHVGLHEIIGAYMAGLFVGRMREKPDALLLSRIRLNAILDDMTTVLQSILTPLFFVFVGLRFAPEWSQLNLFLLSALILVAFAGKLMGCGAGGMAVGYKKKELMEIGTAMCPRGSLELAVLHFGLFSGVLSQELFAIMVVATLATTILAPMLFKFVSKT